MFLNKNNTVKWKKLGIATLICGALVVAGFMGEDVFLMPYFAHLNMAACSWIDKFGSWKVLAGVSLGLCLVLKLLKRGAKFRVAMANSLIAIIASEALVGAIKMLVGRGRAPLEAFKPFALADTWHSFPSGHAAAAFAMMVSIGLAYPKAKVLTWSVAIIAGVSRIAFGAHFPSDVLAGAFIGMVCADLVVWVRQMIKNNA